MHQKYLGIKISDILQVVYFLKIPEILCHILLAKDGYYNEYMVQKEFTLYSMCTHPYDALYGFLAGPRTGSF